MPFACLRPTSPGRPSSPGAGTMTVMRRLGVLATLLLVVAGCTSAGADDKTADGDGGELGASRWVLQSMTDAGALTIVPDGLYADAEFTSLRVKGFSGCNDYDAVYRNAGPMLLVSEPVTTRMACPEPASTFESSYLALLRQSRFYNVRTDTLTVRGPDRAVLLVFAAAPANPLLGSWIVDSFESAPNTLSAPIPDSHMTAIFGLHSVAGFSGCNSYTGPYTTNGSVVAIGPIGTTKAACADDLMAQEDDLMAQETAYLAALQGVARVEPRGRTLQLQDRNGVVAVILARSVEPEASPSASASAAPSATASPSAGPSATPTAAPSPTPAPTPTATPAATPAPTATPDSRPPPAPRPPPPRHTGRDPRANGHPGTDGDAGTDRDPGADRQATALVAAPRDVQRRERDVGRGSRFRQVPGLVAHSRC